MYISKVSVAVVAHVDHGKSTFCDCIISLCANITLDNKSPTLDSHSIEKSRNVTIRNHFISLEYKKIHINLIDTPGHYDFCQYTKVGINVCDVIIMLIDITKGIQAQTMSYIQECKNQNKIIIPVLNKIDTNITDKVDDIKKYIGSIVNCDSIISVSAKHNTNVNAVLDEVIKHAIQYNHSNINDKLTFKIIDCFKSYGSTVLFIRILTGIIYIGTQVYYNNKAYYVTKLEVKKLSNVCVNNCYSGDFCYIHINIHTDNIDERDTLIGLKYCDKVFVRYIELAKPSVFISLRYINEKDYDKFLAVIKYHQMNEQGVSLYCYNSRIYGRIIRCGFYGDFHKEIFIEKLSLQQYNKFKVYNAEIMYYDSKQRAYFMYVDLNKIKTNFKEYIRHIYTPFYHITVQSNIEFYNKIMSYLNNHVPCSCIINTTFTSDSVIFDLQISGRILCMNFIANIKNITKGYVNTIIRKEEYKQCNLSVIEFTINKNIIQDLTCVELNVYALSVANNILDNIQNNMSREQFEMVINVLINKKIVSRRVIKPYRKDVTAKCYGGDSSRKSKLLKRQAKGKTKLLQQVNWKTVKDKIITIIRNSS